MWTFLFKVTSIAAQMLVWLSVMPTIRGGGGLFLTRLELLFTAISKTKRGQCDYSGILAVKMSLTLKDAEISNQA